MVRKVLLEPFRKQDAKPTKKVFSKSVAKTVGAQARKIFGIEQLEQFLISEGFEGIDFATLSLVEKIEYLQEVDTILTTFGSASININISLNSQVKDISILLPISFTQGNIMGHNGQIPTYTCPVIFPVYPNLCTHNGYLLPQRTVSLCYNHRHSTGQFFTRHPEHFGGSFSFKIEMDVFKKFYKYYTEKIGM
jgi:hypothetical protein